MSVTINFACTTRPRKANGSIRTTPGGQRKRSVSGNERGELEMAIEPGCVPATAIEAVSAGMIRAAVPSFASSNLARARRHGLSLAMPHRVAYLPFGAIHPHLDLRQSTHMRSWRFLVLEAQAADSENGAAVEGAFAPIAAVTAVA